MANRKLDLAIERRIRIKIIGINAKFIDWGIIATEKRKPDEVRNNILNQIWFLFLVKRVINAIIKNGLSQRMLKFIFMAWWSVKKLKKTIKIERIENMKNRNISI